MLNAPKLDNHWQFSYGVVTILIMVPLVLVVQVIHLQERWDISLASLRYVGISESTRKHSDKQAPLNVYSELTIIID